MDSFFSSFELPEIIVDYFILGPIPFKALSLLPLSFVCIYLRSIRTILFSPVSSSHIRDLTNKTSSTVSQSFHDLIALQLFFKKKNKPILSIFSFVYLDI